MNLGNDVVKRVLKHNFQLNKRMVSASFQAFLFSPEKYIKGEFQYLPFIKNENSTPVPSPFVLRTIKNYALEYNLETYRMSYYPTFPSRLGALYAFGRFPKNMFGMLRRLKSLDFFQVCKKLGNSCELLNAIWKSFHL